MILLLGLLWSFWTEPVLCLQEDGGLSLDGDIRHFAVTNDSLYISTEEKLYQLSHDLVPVWTLTQRGVLMDSDQPDQQDFQRVSEGKSTFIVNLLLPFVRDKSVISCGVIDDECGFCELLDLKNISKLLYKEAIQVGPLRRSSASVGFLVDVEKPPKTFILTAIQQDSEDTKESGSDNKMINLHDADKSSPVCTNIEPSSTWVSGKRNITINGTHLNFVEGVTHGHAPLKFFLPTISSCKSLTYETPAAENAQSSGNVVFLKVANQTLTCPTKISYYPDPEFTGFTVVRTGNDIRITIQKNPDKLNMTTGELLVWGIQDGKRHPCIMKEKESSNKTDSFVCEISGTHSTNFRELQIQYGGQFKRLKHSASLLLFMLLVLLLIPIIVVAVVFVYRRKEKKFTAKMNRMMEDLEFDIRNDIRQGFVDLQTEKADLMENVGAIPFLDYKHFASRIFFPESESLIKLCVKDIGQDVQTVQLDECCQGLSQLIQDQLFLTTMVHALEEQKSFTIKDKCSLASLLTVALHSNLSYLTEVMEVLLKDLMQQNSNAQPKLLLRRTEFTVEKLLTNWVSICLYGFLRESVGQHLFLLVSALTQQGSKGPVDCVTEKALYTLSEDWLLWQAQDFSPVKLKVLFAVGGAGEVSEPLEVDALSCDAIEQLKEKILSTFKTKFGFPYNTTLRNICIEYEKDGRFLPLQEVDSTSEVIGELKKLNTLRHYQVEDGGTIKVLSKKTHPPLSPQGSLKGTTPGIKSDFNVTFVDGFQISSTVYLFSNVGSKTKNRIRLLWLEGKTSKPETLKSLRGATLRISDGTEGSKLLASSVILGGQQVLWSGVFSVDGGPSKTQLVLFDISPDLSGTKDTDPDFYTSNKPETVGQRVELKQVLSRLTRTKVAVHSYVENLFRSIWGTSQGRAPHAVKYFFDFLDAQANNMKISDPDVRHIWKTNSLPLRFWINILKNPQFVFDMDKSPHLDACLSVIAQAFMDSFSLSELQLGKHAPTNKLLYAKDIPKFKQEVKVYYKQVREQSPVTDAEFKDFLQGESKKHENEFNEAAALKELYKFIQRYFTEIREKLCHSGAPAELTEQLQHVKESFDGLKSCSWI
ncbi:plexin-C1-like [Nematolebias whitei]|uniref:plexin-C1-like n=1 Tax=Nematolebias whitei TaxID=451745 RepID=UPI001898CFE2|nr:plexin-C1-like [Nematolebias whitei]